MPKRDDDAPPDDKVGYGRPPKEHRFRKGRSGNPKGRPTGSANLTSILRDIAKERVAVRDGQRSRRVSKLALLVHGQVNKAAKGDTKAFAVLTSLLERAGLMGDAVGEKPKLTPHQQEQLDRILRRLDWKGPEDEDV